MDGIIMRERKYKYKGYEYFITYTGISHIDNYSHEQAKAHIDRVIKYKKIDNYNGDGRDLEHFFDLIENDK